MKELDIYKPYIDGFNKQDWTCFYEEFGGFWTYQEPELEQKLKENSISFISTLFYFSGVVKQLLNEDDDKQFKEMILRYMLD